MRKFLTYLKDFFVGLLFLGLTAGFVLLVAGAMFYFKPQDFVGDAASLPPTLKPEEIELGIRLLKLGGLLALASVALIWANKKIEFWLKHRKPKEIKEEPKEETQQA